MSSLRNSSFVCSNPFFFVNFCMGKRFNMQDINSRVVLNSKFGVGLEVVDLKQRTKRASLLKKMIRQEEKLDSLGEELRVLYVAYTRAKEKLIITGTMSNLEKKQAEYESVQEESDMKFDFLRLSKATTYWDFVLPALARHRSMTELFGDQRCALPIPGPCGGGRGCEEFVREHVCGRL